MPRLAGRERGIGCDGEHMDAKRHQAGQRQADRHVVVDAQHIRAQALIDFGATSPGCALPPAGTSVAVEVGHVFL